MKKKTKTTNLKTAAIKMIRNKIRALLTALALISLIIAGCSSSDSSSKPDGNSNTATVNSINVPQFSARDIDGELRHSSEWLGKQPVVINV